MSQAKVKLYAKVQFQKLMCFEENNSYVWVQLGLKSHQLIKENHQNNITHLIAQNRAISKQINLESQPILSLILFCLTDLMEILGICPLQELQSL